MNKSQQLSQLRQIADLMLDSQLFALRRAARAKAESEARLAGLDRTIPAPASLSEIAAGIAALSYQRWADARRAELNVVLARQTVAWTEARDAARLSFGRKQVLQSLSGKLAENLAQKARR